MYFYPQAAKIFYFVVVKVLSAQENSPMIGYEVLMGVLFSCTQINRVSRDVTWRDVT